MRQTFLLPTLAALILPAAHAIAHEHDPQEPPAGNLGVVTFETSCDVHLRPEFNRAVALLHSFWHNEAQRAFESVAARDPECAMAYWGEAMTHAHQILDWPTAAEQAAGSHALARADAARKKSAREQAYIRALHLLFDGYAAHFYENAKRYADAMADLCAQYPEDVEAKTFYALALLTSDPPDDLDLVNPKKAVAILYPILREHPDHPGVAHYIIHASDNPSMAQEGLEAARRYAAIAPAAPHALHMPAHIFARLGLWQDDIRSNLASKASAERAAGAHVGAENRLHAIEFLEYAYLQTGQFEAARAMVTEAGTVRQAEVDARYPTYYAQVESRFPALFAVETQDWAMAARLEPITGASWYGQGLTLLAHAIAAGHTHDPHAGKAAADSMDSLVSTLPAWQPGSANATLPDEIHAWSDFAQGDLASARSLLQALSARQARVGKGEVELPAGEMLADMLLLSGKADEALRQYTTSLASDPNRFNALLGAGQAAEESGEAELAAQYYRTVIANSAGASGTALDRLAHARSFVALR